MHDSWDTYFQPGETLLWEGAPKPGVHGWPKIIGLAVFGTPFLLIGIGVFFSGLQQVLNAANLPDIGLGLFFTAFGVPFAGVGALMVFGQWWAASQAHRKIRYAVSTRCAYIARSWWTRSLESYPILPGSALGLEKGRHADTVWFHLRSEKDSDGDRTTNRISFDTIDDGEKVYNILRSIQSGQA